ncbi:MFS transporter [uncultured Desulfosarcina sp.]|uniref:MFS transporter n=1 Tax=uncultured Desulfosarcina sp. TaxID=218289 RepID=UPI0029C807FB|nr:MFS transporter [uncultured Desulfosarcina sp.]
MQNGTDRIRVLITCSLAVFWPGSFLFGFPGVLRQHWQQVFEADASAVGKTVFFILAGATCVMYFCGLWQERYGPGRLAAIGSLLCGSSTIGLRWAAGMAEVNLWAFCVGAASAFVYLPGLTVVQHWFPERRGLVAGLFNMAFGLSAAIMSPVFTLFLSKWSYGILTTAAGSAALATGLIASRWIAFPTQSLSRQAPIGHEAPTGIQAGEALKSRAFWCLWLTWVLAGAAGVSMLVLATGFGLTRGMDLSSAVVLLTAFNLTNGCGRLISGYFSDRFGRSRTMAISFTAAGIAYLIMPHAATPWGWAVMAAVIGFAFGTMFAVSGPLAGDCFGMAHFGAIFGLVFTAYGFVAGPIGPWLSGYLLDRTGGNYVLVFSLLGTMYLLASGLILLVRPWRECRI